LSVGHPLFNFISTKTVIGADLEKWNSAIASQFVDCGPMKPEIIGYFGIVMICRGAAGSRGFMRGI
jgi:hypothetical protein